MKNVYFFYVLVLTCVTQLLTAQNFPYLYSLKYFQELENFPVLSCCPQSEPQDSDYEIVFEDNFEEGFKVENWHTDRPGGGRCYWDGSWTPLSDAVWFGEEGENVFVEDGLLKLVADQRVPGEQCNNKVANYSAGQVWSQQHFRYGKFEFGFKVPKGAALYPSIWMQTNNGGGNDEIDIMESFGKNNDSDIVAYSNGSLNSASGAYEAYGQALTNRSKASLLRYETWAVAELTWTPYELYIKINGTKTMHVYKYYYLCGETLHPITCSTPNPITSCGEDIKFVENMSFPDDEMKINIWLNFQPYADWSDVGAHIGDTGTDLPATFEISHVVVKQVPASTWGVCEDNLFCTYSTPGHLGEALNFCSYEYEAEVDPTVLSLYPSNSPNYTWDNATLETSSNLYAHISEDELLIDQPYPTSGTEWFEIHIPADADATCIGQNRILRKELDINTCRFPDILIDGNVAIFDPTDNNILYYVSKGTHEIDVKELLPGEIVNYEIQIQTANGSPEIISINEPLILDFSSTKRVFFRTTYASGCYRKFSVFISPICEESLFELLLDGENITPEGFYKAKYFAPCFGQYPVQFNSNGTSYEIFSVKKVDLSTNSSTSVNVVNNEFTVQAGVSETLYEITFKSTEAGCSAIKFKLTVVGHCCYPDNVCDHPNGCPDHTIYPNPTSNIVNITMPGSAMDDNGTTYQPQIAQVNVFDLYNMNAPIQLNFDGFQSTAYTLDVSTLQSDNLYILEVKDQLGKTCHENLIITD
ncbi:MAG: family 16 glycosylhydrolase [Bacteroidetes bacterium]|nr:family 16 glycosylhydrolase [Bacteroidota bacterium]